MINAENLWNARLILQLLPNNKHKNVVIVNSIIKQSNRWIRNQFYNTLESEHTVPGTTPIR